MSGLFGVLSGLFLVWGYQLEKIDRIDLSDNNAMLVMVMLMIVMAVDALVFHQEHTKRQKVGILLVLAAMVLLNL